MTDAELDPFRVSEERLREMCRRHAEFVADCLSDGKHTGWMPKVEVFVKAGPGAEEELVVHALACDFNEHEEKHGVMFEIGKALYEQQKFPIAIVMSSESWTVTQRSGTKASRATIRCASRTLP